MLFKWKKLFENKTPLLYKQTLPTNVLNSAFNWTFVDSPFKFPALLPPLRFLDPFVLALGSECSGGTKSSVGMWGWLHFVSPLWNNGSCWYRYKMCPNSIRPCGSAHLTNLPHKSSCESCMSNFCVTCFISSFKLRGIPLIIAGDSIFKILNPKTSPLQYLLK